eukprot:gene26702-22265_t
MAGDVHRQQPGRTGFQSMAKAGLTVYVRSTAHPGAGAFAVDVASGATADDLLNKLYATHIDGRTLAPDEALADAGVSAESTVSVTVGGFKSADTEDVLTCEPDIEQLRAGPPRHARHNAQAPTRASFGTATAQ